MELTSSITRAEPGDRPQASLPRTLTLEAQRDISTRARALKIWHSVFPVEHIPENPLENRLKATIPQFTEDEQTALKQLFRDYARFKNNSADPVFNNIVYCSTIQDGTAGNVVKSQFNLLKIDPGWSFSASVDALSQRFLEGDERCLRETLLCFEAASKILSNPRSYFSASQKFTATLRGRLRLLPLAPNKFIAFLIAHLLKIEWALLDLSRVQDIASEPRNFPQLPSRTIRTGNLDPSQLENNRIVLKWQRHPPHYTTDFNVYIWEEYKRFPSSRRAFLQFYPRTGTVASDLVITFQHRNTMLRFMEVRSTNQCESEFRGQGWSVESEMYFATFIVFQVMVDESIYFLRDFTVELERIDLAGRQDPAISKMRYLMHLEDVRVSACNGILHGIQVLNCLRESIMEQQASGPIWDGGTPFETRVTMLQRDLEFIQDELSKLQGELGKVKQTLREHFDLTQNFRSFILTIVAAFYLPLSFTTSIFGMNMNTTTPSGPSGFSNWTTTWINNSPANVQNSTKALVSTIGSSGSQTYAWKTFTITATSLIFTLPLSLAAGSLLRMLYRGTTYYATYWRVIAIFPSIAFIFYSIFGTLIPRGLLVYATCNSCLWMFEIYYIFHLRRTRAKINSWVLALILTVSCTLIGVITVVPVMIIPWICIFYIWFRLWWNRRRQEK